MIMGLDPKYLIGIGVFLMLLGIVLAYLLLVQIIPPTPPTLILDFVSYAASFLGLIIGMVGAMTIVIRSRRRDR
jgi:hypothetical protein